MSTINADLAQDRATLFRGSTADFALDTGLWLAVSSDRPLFDCSLGHISSDKLRLGLVAHEMLMFPLSTFFFW